MPDQKPKRKYTKKADKVDKAYLNSPKNELATINVIEEVIRTLKKEDGFHTTSVVNSSILLDKIGQPTLIVLKKNKLQTNTFESVVTVYWTKDAKCIGSFEFKGFSWGYKSPEIKNLATFIFNCGVNIKPEVVYSLTNNKLPFVFER